MTILHLPTPTAKTDWERYVELVEKYAGLRDTTLVFGLAVMKRAQENGDAYLAQGAARLIDLIMKERT